MYDSSSELQGTKNLHTWRIEKQGKGNNHESGDDRKQDDQTGINFHPAAEISINLEKISEASRIRAAQILDKSRRQKSP